MIRLLILLVSILLAVGGVLAIGIAVISLIVKLFRAIFHRDTGDYSTYTSASTTSATTSTNSDEITPPPLPEYRHQLVALWKKSMEEKNYDMVFATAKRLVEKGEPYHRSLGECFLYGRGIVQSTEIAIHYFERAVELGDKSDITYYADLLYDGVILPRNQSRGLELYRQAAALDEPRACLKLYRLQTGGDLPGEQYNDHQLAWMLFTAMVDNEPGARKLFKDYRDVNSHYATLYSLQASIAMNHNPDDYLHYTKLAASYGDEQCLYNLGLYYRNIDLDAAIRYMTAAAELYEDVEAMYAVGVWNIGEKGKLRTDRQIEQLVYWLTRAAERNHSDAAYALGLYYFEEYQYNMHLKEEAFLEWLRLAAHLGNRDAMFLLYKVHSKKYDICPNPTLAREYLEMAANAGVLEARSLLWSGKW